MRFGDTMLALKNNPVLSQYQVKILKIFFTSPLSEQFFLTGGTALAAFYLGHRQSKDLDFFSLSDFDTLRLEKVIEEIAQETGAAIKVKVKSKTYHEIYLEDRKGGWIQRLDFIREQPVVFGQRKKIDSITVDSLENIASGKILTLYSRFEAKDYLDLYFIGKETKLDLMRLFEKTKRKDLGLNEFYFANMIAEVENLSHFPKTIKPFNKKDLEKFYLDLSQKLFLKIKPKE